MEIPTWDEKTDTLSRIHLNKGEIIFLEKCLLYRPLPHRYKTGKKKKKGWAENHVLRELFLRRKTSYKRNHYHLSSPVIGKF